MVRTRRKRAVRQAPFRCTGCGFDLDEPTGGGETDLPLFHPAAGRNAPRTAAREKLWWECPAGGPTAGLFRDPENRDPRRCRYTFRVGHGEETATVCTAVVEGTGAAILTPGQLRREWYLHRHRQLPGQTSDLDLAHFRRAMPLPGPDIRRITRISGRWFLRNPSMRMNPWSDSPFGQKAFRLIDAHGKPSHLLVLMYRALRPASPPFQEFLLPDARTSLHLTIDLRAPIQEQLDAMKPSLLEVQACLHRLAEQPLPRPGRGRQNVWRDIYIHLLRQLSGWTAPEIAAEVFPRERGDSRVALKVRNILSEVRSQLPEDLRTVGVNPLP